MILAQREELVASLSQMASSMPPNIAAEIGPDVAAKVFKQMFDDFVWPQISARLSMEPLWDRLKTMYRVGRDETSGRQRSKPENTTYTRTTEEKSKIADTIIFDTVDRLKNLTHFICWKESPVQYNRPQYIYTPFEDEFYSPTSRKLQSANAILDWNNQVQDIRQKSLKLNQHHFLYGCSFVFSDFTCEVEELPKSPDYLLIKSIGTTFEPISLRKLWLNPTIPIDQMEKQVCPFFFDLELRSNILANPYNPILNPFGYVNLDKIGNAQYLFGTETGAFQKGLPDAIQAQQVMMRPEFAGEAKWTFYPVLDFGEGSKRYIVQIYSNNLFSGQVMPIRIQELYYPKKRLPIYGSSHIPDLDSGLYTPSIAELLEPHYDELVRAKTQFLDNKDWINNPPTEVMVGSPAANRTDLNKPGVVYEVTGINEVRRRELLDATASNIQFIEQTRDSAQTTGKAVDAILGKAMGSRTSATEASNAFQASMSGVTADVDNFAAGIYIPYSQRVWENFGAFVPTSIRDLICGNCNAPKLSEQDLMIEIGMKADVGSSFIESISKQAHIQQAIISSTTSPVLDQAKLWKAWFSILKLPEGLDSVRDNGVEKEIAMATEQAISTYLGKPVIISPIQNHEIAMQVKMRFLEDTNSVYNKEYAANPSAVPNLTTTQYLSQQINMHQQFVLLQQKQMLMVQEAQVVDERQAEDRKNAAKGSTNAKKTTQPQQA